MFSYLCVSFVFVSFELKNWNSHLRNWFFIIESSLWFFYNFAVSVTRSHTIGCLYWIGSFTLILYFNEAFPECFIHFFYYLQCYFVLLKRVFIKFCFHIRMEKHDHRNTSKQQNATILNVSFRIWAVYILSSSVFWHRFFLSFLMMSIFYGTLFDWQIS